MRGGKEAEKDAGGRRQEEKGRGKQTWQMLYRKLNKGKYVGEEAGGCERELLHLARVSTQRGGTGGSEEVRR